MSTQTSSSAAIRTRRRSRRLSARDSLGARIRGAAILTILVAVWMTPLIGLIVTSLRGRVQATETGWWTAVADPSSEAWTAQNFSSAIDQFDLGRGLLNSLTVAIPSTILPVVVAAFAAYGFTFFSFRGKEVYFAVFLGLLVIPIQVALVPILRTYVWAGDALNVHIAGTFPGIWLIHSAFALPLAIYILRNFMATLPVELIEAARVDGASHLLIFWRLVVPLSVPALASFAIFQFLWVWNDLLIATIFLGADKHVLTQNLYQMLGRYGQGWQQVGAGSLITMAVPILVFVSLQRYFVRGLTAGAVK